MPDNPALWDDLEALGSACGSVEAGACIQPLPYGQVAAFILAVVARTQENAQRALKS